MTNPALSQLREQINRHFNEEELRALCFDLDIEYDNLGGRGKADKARELIALCQRKGRLPELQAHLKRLRPQVDWDRLFVAIARETPPGEPGSLFPLHHIPYPRNANFTGREAWLTQLHTNLSAGGTAAGRLAVITQAIAGLGGVGKTQLALEYCYRHRQDYDLVYWLSADDEAALAASLAALAVELGVAGPTAEQAEAVQAARHWLERAAQRWLLVYDNADQIEPRALAAYLPRLGQGACLITSRNPNWGTLTGAAGRLRLDVFTPEEAAAFLLGRVGAGAQEGEVEELAKELGYFPLALEHAAAYMAEHGKSAAAYLDLYRRRQAELWERATPRHDYEKTITTTWEVAFAQARATAGAGDLLNLCCFLDGDGIPLRLLTDHADALPADLGAVAADELALDTAVTALARYSLLARADETLTLHRLVQAVARQQMGEERRATWAAAAVELLATAYRFNPHDMTTWAACGQLMPHLATVTKLAADLDITSNRAAFLNNEAGFYLQHYGSLAAARPYYEHALAVTERALGPDHPDTATSLNNLGSLLQDLGDLAAARPYLERALAVRERALGPDHPDTATSLGNLGYLLQAMGDLAAARPYLERALAVRERALGPDHPDTTQSFNNLGSLLQAMGDLAAARPYYERALAVRERALGPDHPDTAQSFNNLGALLQAMGDLAAARPYYERALAVHERALGPDHPDTARSLNNLAVLCAYQEDFEEAARLMRRALSIREMRLGANHPDTQSSRESLAAIEDELRGSRK